MSKGWSEERRRQQAERIRHTKPWQKSTGPQTPEGKARASMNAFKHGGRSLFAADIKVLLRLNRAFLKQYEQLALAEAALLCETNGLIKRKINQGGTPATPDKNPKTN